MLRPQENDKFFGTETDTWYVSRVCGTFKERTGHPCQMPEGVLERIIRVASNPGDVVLDPFAGSGTTLSEDYAEAVRGRLANGTPHSTRKRRGKSSTEADSTLFSGVQKNSPSR